MGLDAKRFAWSSVPALMQVLGALITLWSIWFCYRIKGRNGDVFSRLMERVREPYDFVAVMESGGGGTSCSAACSRGPVACGRPGRRGRVLEEHMDPQPRQRKCG
jgi:hypothetical protein